MEKRNGFVDFLKFVFAIIILFHHSVELFRGSNTYFISGYIAVEFYFMVSGYLLAKKSECSLTSDNCSKSIYDENIKAFIRKVKSFSRIYWWQHCFRLSFLRLADLILSRYLLM